MEGGSIVYSSAIPPHVHCPRCRREIRVGSICSICRNVPIAGGNPAAQPPSVVPEAPGPSAPATPVRTLAPALELTAAGPVGADGAAPAPRKIRFSFEIAIDRGPPKKPNAAGVAHRPFRPIDLWKRYLPPVRLVWIFLGVLMVYGGAFVTLLGSLPFLAIPLVSVLADLGFQRARFPKVRFPDTAIVTSLFLALLVWPGQIDLPLIAIVVATVALRHVVRFGGHPIFNPVSLGLTVGFFVFGMQTSWHIGLDTTEVILVVIFGLILIARARHTWRFPLAFFGVYVPVTVASAVVLGATDINLILWTGALAAQPVFYGMFMVTEPRTAPSARPAMLRYGVLVGLMASLMPVFFSEVPYIGALGAIAPFLALFVGNLYTLSPGARGARATVPTAPRVARPPSTPASAARGPLATSGLRLETGGEPGLSHGSHLFDR